MRLNKCPLLVGNITFSTQAGDIFLLCSEGLYNVVSKEETRAVPLELPVDQAVDSLIEKALRNGSDDNVSVILVNGELSKATPKNCTREGV